MITDSLPPHDADCVHDNTLIPDDERCRVRRYVIGAKRAARFLDLRRSAVEAERYFNNEEAA